MGVFSVSVDVSHLEGRDFQRVDAWADTGSFYSSLPRAFLESLGVTPHKSEAFKMADGRIADREIGRLWMRAEGRAEITLVIFGEPDSPPVLGAYTLEGLALAVDPLNQRLVPLPWLLRAECVPA